MNSTALALDLKTESLNNIAVFSIPFSVRYLMPTYGKDESTDAEFIDDETLQAVARCEDDIKNNRLFTIDEVFGELGV